MIKTTMKKILEILFLSHFFKKLGGVISRIKENSKKNKHANALVVDTSSSAPQKNINIRITISLIFLALIVPLFLGFISYSYKNNYEIFKGNANQQYFTFLMA